MIHDWSAKASIASCRVVCIKSNVYSMLRPSSIVLYNMRCCHMFSIYDMRECLPKRNAICITFLYYTTFILYRHLRFVNFFEISLQVLCHRGNDLCKFSFKILKDKYSVGFTFRLKFWVQCWQVLFWETHL